MKLETYLSENKITVSQFAQTIGRSAATVSRITRNLNQPNSKTMLRIKKETGGAVLPNDFFEAA